MKKIENITQLNAEIARLKSLAKEQENLLKNDLLEIRETLKPANLLVSGLSSITGVKITGNELLKDGLAYGLSVLFQRFILKTEKKLEHQVYEFVDTLIDRVKSFLEQFTNQEAKRSERRSDDKSSGENV